MKLDALRKIIKEELAAALKENAPATKEKETKEKETEKTTNPLKPKDPSIVPNPGNKPGERPAKAQTPQKEGMSKGIADLVKKYKLSK